MSAPSKSKKDKEAQVNLIAPNCSTLSPSQSPFSLLVSQSIESTTTLNTLTAPRHLLWTKQRLLNLHHQMKPRMQFYPSTLMVLHLQMSTFTKSNL